jgi:hypothetical protein
MRSTPQCPAKQVDDEVYVSGTEPVNYCTLHGGKGTATTVSAWDTSTTETLPPAQNYVPGPAVRQNGTASAQPPTRRTSPDASSSTQATPKNPTPTQQPKKGFFDRVKGIFH